MMILLMALTGAFIGWGTNLIAVKLLFKPLKPFKIPLTPIVFQGLIPKRRAEIAASVAKTIEEDLVDLESIFNQLIETMDKEAILAMLEEKLSVIIKANLPTLLQSFSGTIQKYVHEMMVKQGDQLLTEIAESLMHRAINDIKISEMIEEKIMAMDILVLEDMIIQLTKTELKQIEVLGGVLGFLIGIVQGIFAVMLG